MLNDDIDEFIAACNRVIDAAKGVAGVYRTLLALVVVYHSHPDKFTAEDAARIEAQIARIDPDFLKLPWEEGPFDLEEAVSNILKGATE